MTAPRVKICGLRRRSDVQSAVQAGADALGFVFTPRSKRFLEAGDAAGLVDSVPAFVARVGLFMDQEAEEVRAVLDRVALSLLQFHGNESGAVSRQFGRPYITAVSMAQGASADDWQREYPDAAALLLDSHEPGGAGGTGQTFDWRTIPAMSHALVLAGGLSPANVARAVAQVRPWAVDVSSGVEDAPGIKNEQKMITFIQEAKRES